MVSRGLEEDSYARYKSKCLLQPLFFRKCFFLLFYCTNFNHTTMQSIILQVPTKIPRYLKFSKIEYKARLNYRDRKQEEDHKDLSVVRSNLISKFHKLIQVPSFKFYYLPNKEESFLYVNLRLLGESS